MPKRVIPVLAFAVSVILLGAAVGAESAPLISECDLCLEVGEQDPYPCLGSVSAIPSDEEDIYVRIRLEGRIYESHEVTVRWIDPSGELHHEETASIPSPSAKGYEYWSYYVIWRGIRIAGSPASEMLGAWRVVVFVDGEERCTKTFTVNLSQETSDAIAACMQECATVRPSSNHGLTWDLVFIEVNVGREAAEFPYVILYDTEASGGAFAGQEIGLGPNARSLELGGVLDEFGAASIEIPWPDDVETETLFFQVLIATTPLELLGGSFWTSNVVTVDRPSEEPPIAGTGFDQPVGGLGTDYMFGCVPDSSLVIENCFNLQLSPAGLIAGAESALDVAFDGDGFAVVSPSAEPHDGETGHVAYLPVSLPLRPCCEELELTGLSFCYQSLTSEDMIESVQIGYLSDSGSFEGLAVVEGDLASLTWACASVRFRDVTVFRPLVIRIWFAFGGAAPFAAGGGMRLGNIRAVLAPPGPWSGHSSPGNITCAKLLTCFPWGGGWGPGVGCSDGAQYRDYQPNPPKVIVYFWSHCDESITCEGWKVLDEMGEVVWAGGWVVRTEPAPDDGIYQWGKQDYYLGECFLPGEGNYEVVLQTSLGEFRKKFSIELPD